MMAGLFFNTASEIVNLVKAVALFFYVFQASN